MSALLAFILKPLADPRLLAGLGFAALLAFAGVQTARLGHAKADLAAARAALVDPATHASWRAEALADAQNLATARQNVAAVSAALDSQQAAVKALEARSAADTAAADQGARAADARAAAAAADAARVMARAAGPDPCKAADDLILGSLP
jgi:hypothetical protein